MTPERIDILHMAFHTAKLKGLLNDITPTLRALHLNF